jgi:tetratricopeptide (TPR) repeat protein
MHKPNVFISYSHLDEEWKDRLVRQLAVSQKQGRLELWHDRMIGAGEDWERQIQAAMDAASVAILLVSANSLTSDFILREEVSRLLERRASEGLRIFPVVIEPCDWEAVDWLRRMNLRPKDGKPLSGGNDYEIDLAVAEIAKEIRKLLKRTAPPTKPTFVPLSPDDISISRLPRLLTPDLFGRERELQVLDDAWANPQTNVISFVAWGGVGKSALISHWLQSLERDQWRGAERVFAWSFFSQGTSDHAATAEFFINAALRWFGGDELADKLQTEGQWEKGERLAQLIRQTRTLLILDGLESAQYPPMSATASSHADAPEGGLKEQTMQALLRELASHLPGLCVVTTRVAIADLVGFEGRSVVRHPLDELSPAAGAQLLRRLKVRGTLEELEAASREYGGHSLALTLLGSYLGDVYAGDVRRLHEIESLTADAQHGGHARRVMASYEKWLGDGPELAILRLLGLFDRPADAGSIAALRAAPVIPGLTDALQPLSGAQWRQTLAKLRRIRLLAERPAQSSHEAEDELDAHPLVREHFGQQLRRDLPEAWRAAHDRLYEHLTLTTPHLPDTIDEIARLYSAMAHGCEAGRHQDALDRIYYKRIHRETKHFAVNNLGLIEADLAALSHFFAPPWQRLVEEIKRAAKGYLLMQVGYRMRAMGRLKEAIQLMKAAHDEDVAYQQILASDGWLGSWSHASIVNRELSEICLVAGDIAQALSLAQLSLKLANHGDEWEWTNRVDSACMLANALHHVGLIREAAVIFRDAEAFQKKHQPGYPLLYSREGFQYCDLLLSQRQTQKVIKRATKTLKWAKQRGTLSDVALDNLTLGRAHFSAMDADACATALPFLRSAVDGLRRAGHLDDLPRGLMARAALYRLTGDYHLAQRDLDEALRIATRGSMRLHEADCHLESARLALATGDRDSASKAWETARAMVEEMGYHRRDEEVKEIERHLKAD